MSRRERSSTRSSRSCAGINHLPGTVEACATRHGTLVGPIQTDITGFEELTPYRGGWCGNDVFPGVFDEKTRKQIRTMARRLGDRLYAEGYPGCSAWTSWSTTTTARSISARSTRASPARRRSPT